MDLTVLRKCAEEADKVTQHAREQLVRAIRLAHAAGASQRQIAIAVNRSQPEVNRLLRFHGRSRNGLALRKVRSELGQVLHEAGLLNPRVFGSTAAGTDNEGSDIDLLVTPSVALSLLEQARVENELTQLVGVPVDLVFDSALREDIEARVLAAAVPL